MKKSKNLLFVDKADAMKSARSLSRTIDGLIGKEQGKLSQLYESQIQSIGLRSTRREEKSVGSEESGQKANDDRGTTHNVQFKTQSEEKGESARKWQ